MRANKKQSGARDVSDLRESRQRRLVLGIVAQSRSHPTAQDVYEEARRVIPTIGLGTVYRNFRRMAGQGLLQENKIGKRPMRFEAPLRRHYHILCVQCGKLEDLALPYQDSLDRKVQRQVRYRLQEHRMEFYGICPECRRRSGATRRVGQESPRQRRAGFTPVLRTRRWWEDIRGVDVDLSGKAGLRKAQIFC